MVRIILDNEESKNQSLLFIRDLIRKDEGAFNNKVKIEVKIKENTADKELESLKEITVKKLPEINVFHITVRNLLLIDYF